MPGPGAAPELHIPDLPELQLGGPGVAGSAEAAGSGARAGRWRPGLWQRLSNYLPLLLMALLAAGTWWLVRNTPAPPTPAAASLPRGGVDYTMHGFSVTRFDAEGQVRLRIDGAVMRHFAETDRLEIEGVHILATGADGRVTEATAQRALANGDASEVQLIGDARVLSRAAPGTGAPPPPALELRSEFLHAFTRFERLRSHRPVTVQQGRMQLRAAGFSYDHVQQQLQLEGPVQMRWAAPGTDADAAPTAAPQPAS